MRAGNTKWKHLETPFFRSPFIKGRLHDYVQGLHFDDRSKDEAVYCNGAVHWIRDGSASSMPFCTLDGRHEFRREEPDVLHYFEISQERLLVVSVIPSVPSVVENIPLDVTSGSLYPTTWPRLNQRYFGECDSCLYLIETYQHCVTQFDVMEMERDYSAWFVKLLKYHVDLNLLVGAGLSGQDYDPLIVLCCLSQAEESIQHTSDEVTDSSIDLLLHMSGKVISYNLRSETFKTSIELANKELSLASGDDYRL